jgi:hypothetical protein
MVPQQLSGITDAQKRKPGAMTTLLQTTNAQTAEEETHTEEHTECGKDEKRWKEKEAVEEVEAEEELLESMGAYDFEEVTRLSAVMPELQEVMAKREMLTLLMARNRKYHSELSNQLDRVHRARLQNTELTLQLQQLTNHQSRLGLRYVYSVLRMCVYVCVCVCVCVTVCVYVRE